jgi:hypothetical protein
MARKLVLYPVPTHLSDEELLAACRKAGPVARINRPIGRDGEPAEVVICEFLKAEEARAAFDYLLENPLVCKDSAVSIQAKIGLVNKEIGKRPREVEEEAQDEEKKTTDEERETKRPRLSEEGEAEAEAEVDAAKTALAFNQLEKELDRAEAAEGKVEGKEEEKEEEEEPAQTQTQTFIPIDVSQ